MNRFPSPSNARTWVPGWMAWRQARQRKQTMAELTRENLAPLSHRYVHYECLLEGERTGPKPALRRRVTCPERLRAAGL